MYRRDLLKTGLVVLAGGLIQAALGKNRQFLTRAFPKTFDDWEKLQGELFQIGGARWKLETITKLPRKGTEQFTLQFAATQSQQPVLLQGTYPIQHQALGSGQMFVTPAPAQGRKALPARIVAPFNLR